MTVPILLALLLIVLAVGVALGRRGTRRALQTTDGRRRHNMPDPPRRLHPVITGEIAEPSPIEDFLHTASMYEPAAHLTARPPAPALPQTPAPAAPPTVEIRLDNLYAVAPPPAARIGDSVRRAVDDAAAARPTRRYPGRTPRA